MLSEGSRAEGTEGNLASPAGSVGDSDTGLTSPDWPDSGLNTGAGAEGGQADALAELLGIIASHLTLEVTHSGKAKQILTDISVSIKGGELVGVIGASGSGKSTFVQSISGIRRAGAGSVSLAGWEVGMLASKLPLVIGYLPQAAGFHRSSPSAS